MKTNPILNHFSGLCLALLIMSASAVGQEICNNGIDDDADNLIDLNDIDDCQCNSTISVNSLIPNPSFEEYNCVPTFFAELSCADVWEQATFATSDFFLNIPDGFWTPLIPLPVPDGQGVAGFIISSYPADLSGNDVIIYNEYIGGCLLAPMEAGVEYTLEMALAGSSWDGKNSAGAFYGPVDITIFGSGSCPEWPINTDPENFADLGCPASVGDWVELGHTSYSADETWQTITIQFTPETDVQAIMIGGPCEIPTYLNVDGITVPNYPYFWIDNMILNETSLFSSIQTTGSFCTDDLTLTGDSDNLTEDFQWYYDGVAISGQTDSVLAWSEMNMPPGTYQFIAFESDSACAGSQIDISLPEPIQPLISASVQSGCVPLTVLFDNVTPTPALDCEWSFGDGETSNECTTTYQYNESGLYDVGISVTFEDGCTYDTTYQEYIEVHNLPQGLFSTSPQPTTINNTLITFFPESDNNIVQWLWNFGEVFPFTDTTETPSIQFPPVPGRYPVELIVIDANGCADTLRKDIFINADASATLPNIFTPDGDGLNDQFVPVESYPGNWTLTIFNRWGFEVFSTESVRLGWNGGDSPDGTYYWVLQPRDGQLGESRAGYVTLVRD